MRQMAGRPGEVWGCRISILWAMWPIMPAANSGSAGDKTPAIGPITNFSGVPAVEGLTR